MMEQKYSPIEERLNQLKNHPLYERVSELDSLREFMKWHVFAVWDFMTLLKSLQRRLTCVTLPWMPGRSNDNIARLINEIVLGEESDKSYDGTAISHFALYLKAMEEVGADTAPIKQFLIEGDYSKLPAFVAEFVKHDMSVAGQGSDVEVASTFFYGREKLVPVMFEGILRAIENKRQTHPALVYYFERHIEVDSGEHGPKAMMALDFLMAADPIKEQQALASAVQALDLRYAFWDGLLSMLPVSTNSSEETKDEQKSWPRKGPGPRLTF